MEIFFAFNASFLNFNEYEKSNLDHVHFVVIEKKKIVRGMKMKITQFSCRLERKRKPTKQTNLIKMHYTSNPKLHVASLRIFLQ